jgi:hypothetical protein
LLGGYLHKVERHLAGLDIKISKSGEVLGRFDLAVVEDVQHLLASVAELWSL